ncbi:MAG: HNH endonuclease domain-containing protein [Paeniclostridium sordellii]|nr:HNH endonuclease domain-containing protein [Paeniclostridium sordellii]
MIPIILNDDEKENLKNWYIDLIKSKVIVKDINKYYRDVENELKKFGVKVKMENLLVMDYEELKAIQIRITKANQIYDQYKIPKNGRVKGKKYVVDNEILKKTYKLYDKIPKYELINKIGINVCPYCNREFINNRINKTSAQIDHFFPRSKYPIFAISLFNLVPSCYTCNHIKRENIIDLSPYEKNLKSDTYYKFDYLIKGIDYINNKDEIEVIIKEIKGTKNNNRVLKLNDAYIIHNDLVQEIIKKKIVYSDGKIDEILRDFKYLFNSKDEIERILYGNYTKEEELSKRPLSKLNNDIINSV